MEKLNVLAGEDIIKFKDILERAKILFGWDVEDAYKVLVNGEESILFCYHPVFMLFTYDKEGNLEYKSCAVSDDNKVISVTLGDYQVNVDNNMVYLIGIDGRHQSLQILKNNDTPNFEVASNGVITYMQYDEKKDVRVVIRYSQNVYSSNKRVYGDYTEDAFYVSVESKPILRDKGLIFLGSKSAYYRLDFDVWNNRWQYDLATLGEYGLSAVMASDTTTLHGGNYEFSRFYKTLFSFGDYITITGFPFSKAYSKDNIEDLVRELEFNVGIPKYVINIYNSKDEIVKEFQSLVDDYVSEKVLKKR